MHRKFICHRDLKPENFLLNDTGPIEHCRIKIIDFGVAYRFHAGEEMEERVGTCYYMAPEVVLGCYDKLCDLWSCGVIMFILLCGYPPFSGDTNEQILERVATGKFEFHADRWADVSGDAQDLIRELLQKDPQDRFTAGQVLDHIWITDQAPAAKEIPLQAGQLQNMCNFCGQNKLKKAAVAVIARSLKEEHIKQLQEMFESLDANRDGRVTCTELAQGIGRLDLDDLPHNLMEVMQEMDTDMSGSIEYTEFLAATLDKKVYQEEASCWAAFQAFDHDGSGSISRRELEKVLQHDAIEDLLGSNSIENILQECDRDNDGQISFEEFTQMMRDAGG